MVSSVLDVLWFNTADWNGPRISSSARRKAANEPSSDSAAEPERKLKHAG